MAKWLDKYEQGGLVLKKKTKDNFSLKGNANDASVSVGPNFVGAGYDTTGRKYSPAWGGSFAAMGTSIPGSVGFTYARTINPAPANGKYTKKTLASAQNGQEMRYYQDGLDFKPKSISKKGKKIIKDDMGQWAHPGEITEIGSPDITMQGVDYPVLGISDTGDTQMMYPDQDYKFDGDKVTEYPMAQKGKKLTKEQLKQNIDQFLADQKPFYDYLMSKDNQLPSIEELAGNAQSNYQNFKGDNTRIVRSAPDMRTAQQKKDQEAIMDAQRKKWAANKKLKQSERYSNTQKKGSLNDPDSWHIEDKMRLFPNSIGGAGELFDEYLNPLSFVGSMADALGSSIASRDPKGAALALGMAAGAGALGFDPLGSTLKTVPAIGKGLRTLGSKVDKDALAMMFGKEPARRTSRGISQEEIERAMQQVNTLNEQGLSRRVQPGDYVPYEPPTDAELLAMNQAEANRYAPRVDRTGRQRMGTPEDMDALSRPEPTASYSGPEDIRADEMARFRERLAQSNARDRERQSISRLIDDVFGPEEENIAERIGNQSRDARRSPEETERLMEGIRRRVAERVSNPPPPPPPTEVIPPGEFDPNFKFAKYEGPKNFERIMEHPSGNTIYEKYNTSEAGGGGIGNYTIKNKNGVYMEIRAKTAPGNPYIDINNISFFGSRIGADEAVNRSLQGTADEQLKILMKHMPEKATLNPDISTSVYSAPIMNTYVAKLAKDAGRITLEEAGTKKLNPILKSGSKAPSEVDQVLTQFPKIKKSVKMINEKAGTNFFEPYMEFQGNKIDPSYLTSDEFRGILQDNADALHNVKINVPKYKMTKHWKNGGWLDKYK